MLLTREMIFRADWNNPGDVILRGLAAAEKIGNYDRLVLQGPMWTGMSARAGGGYCQALVTTGLSRTPMQIRKKKKGSCSRNNSVFY